MKFALPALLTALLSVVPIWAGPKVAVVVGTDAPKLERFAAEEIAAQFKRLFDADATVANTIPSAFENLILVGSPTTNPAVAAVLGDGWPKLTDQGHILRSVTLKDRKALVVGGGSPVATLWAAYELGQHFGIRPFLHGDVLPEKVPELKLDDIDIKFEPATNVRVWRLMGTSPTSYGGWGLAEYKTLFRQLAKLKFNYVQLGSSKDQKPIPVAGDTPGRKAFKGAKEFDIADLLGKTGAERQAAAQALDRGVAESAVEYGLDVKPLPKLQLAWVSMRGFLPRVPVNSLSDGMGFDIIAEVPGDLGPAVYHLARRAFEPKLTPKEAFTQYFTPIVGTASTERVLLGIGLLGEAEKLVESADKKFELSPDFVANLLKSGDAPPEWWKKAGKHYAGAMDEMYRGIRATYNDPARPVLLYYAKRSEFAVQFFNCLDATRLAGAARKAGDKDAELQHLEKATESIYNALNAYGDVARDPSDRGAIALLAETIYRPLMSELKAASKK
ncbi:MAG: hypothetical protein KF873_09470 [Gemmataceae bacterium]|nr:hypothetical protein [Gemmataceae bacterium]